MANTSVSLNRGAVGDFRIGRVFDRASSVYTRNFLIFTLVPMVAYLPSLLLPVGAGGMAGQNRSWVVGLLAVILTVMLGLLSQAHLV
jgi:predicted permease